MTQTEALKLALVIEEFDNNDENIPMELLKPIAATLRAIAELESQEPVQKTVKFNCTVVDDQHPQGIPLEQWGDPPAAQRTWVGLTKENMPAGENPMFDHEYFLKGMVFAATILKEKNT